MTARERELYRKDLKPGDVILSRAKFFIQGGWESALIVLLDGGHYSHCALFTGEAFIEMITPGIVASPARVKTRVHRYSDVYRFQDAQGHELNTTPDLPALPITRQADGYLNTANAYGYTEALMVAVILILRGALAPRWAQPVLEVIAGIILTRLKRLIDSMVANKIMTMTCSQLVSECFWLPSDRLGAPYGLHVNVAERHRVHRNEVAKASDRLQSVLDQLADQLGRIEPEYPAQLEIARINLHESLRTGASSGISGIEELVAGSSCLPSNCVTPCDLQISRNLRYTGRYCEGLNN